MRSVWLAVILAACGDDGGGGMLSSDKELTAFTLSPIENSQLATAVGSTFMGTDVSAIVPFATDRAALVPRFTTTGVLVEVDGVVQESGVTANDFSLPRTYHVVAEDGSAQDYFVAVDTRLSQQAYLKAQTSSGAIGMSVAASGDGSTVAAGSSEGVHVFVRTGATWSHQALVAPKAGVYAVTVALAADGNTLALTDQGDSSAATGINGDETDTSKEYAGAVYVYTRTGTTWTKQAYVKATNTDTRDFFGQGVALSGDGNTLAVGAASESSAQTGIGQDGTDNSASGAGAVYVYTRSGATWAPQEYIKASNAAASAVFGVSVGLSVDGNRLAVGSPGVPGGGAVYVFSRAGTTWTEDTTFHADNAQAPDGLGSCVALSSAGNVLAACAAGEAGDNDAKPGSGAAYVFVEASTWAQQAYLRASNADQGDAFGSGISLAGDGSALVVGAWNEASAAQGIDGNQADNSASLAGAAYVFTRSGPTWTQRAYLKASNAEMGDSFAFNNRSVAMSRDGTTVAVGAPNERSLAITVDGNQNDNSCTACGAVYVFR